MAGNRRSARLSGIYTQESPDRELFDPIYPDLMKHASVSSTIAPLKIQNDGSVHATTEKASSDEEDFGENSAADTSFSSKSSRSTAVPPRFSPSRQRSLRDPQPVSEDQNLKFIYFTGILVVVLGALLAYKFSLRDGPAGNRGVFEKFERNLKFVTNSTENRVVLRVIGRKTFLDESESPLAIVVSGQQAREFAANFQRIVRESQASAKIATSESQPIEITENMDRAEIHENLLKALTAQKFKSRAVVVNDIDLLKWDAVLAIHAFADHETFPVPKSLLIFTTKDNMSNDGTGCDENVANHLSSKWKTIGANEDNISPIISRISYYICV
ncbi:unnamed protein product [Caenorhabditis angaria]|uniref:Uncharacterized protein n=1 Tax=Caenorhabditis angaria TaxID=860376 RepID=A0A9P1I6J6_9PELO|nr:unnamed protein product [Caenorhabditis angaria]